jgi:hypothetical protein
MEIKLIQWTVKFTADMKYSKAENFLLFVDTNQCLIIYMVQDLDSCSL